MPERTMSDFSVIDKYLSLRDDPENSETDEDLLTSDQQNVPFFSSPPSPPFPGHLTPKRESKPNATFHHLSQSPLSEQQQQSVTSTDSQTFLGFMDNFLDDLPPQTLPSHVSASPVPSPHFITLSSAKTTTFVTISEAAGSGGMVIQARDQQVLDMEDVVLCDLDKPSSFYDDSAMDIKPKIEPAMDWLSETSVSEMTYAGLTPASLMGDVRATESLTSEDPTLKTCTDAIEALRADILEDCRQLGISPDPREWRAEDTQRWVRYILHKHQIPDDCSAALSMEGRSLCQHEKEFFVLVSQDAGPCLQQQLDLWTTMAAFGTALPQLPSQTSSACTDLSSVSLPGDSLRQPSPSASSSTYQVSPSISPAPSTDSCNSNMSSSSDTFSFTWFNNSTDDEVTLPTAPTSSSDRKGNSRKDSQLPASSNSSSQRAARPSKQIRLWEFLKELLMEVDPSMKWLDQAKGIFKIEDSNRVAKLWGQRKNRPAMNYDKLSRSVRQYYKKGIIKKTAQSRRLVYQFSDSFL